MLTPVFGSTKYGTCKIKEPDRNITKATNKGGYPSTTLYGIRDNFTDPHQVLKIICYVITYKKEEVKIKSYM
jgi:hypothetical protein